MLKSFLKLSSDHDTVVVPDELQKLGQYMLQFHTYCSDCVHAADIRIVVDNLERFKDLDIRCWELFLTDHSYCAIAGLYSMLLDVVVPLDGVEDEELISKFLSWLGFLTKLLPASGYQRIPIQMRLIANLAQILKAYPNERIASLLANILELIARNHDGDRIDASVNQTGLKNCLHTILSCFDSLYLRDSHILVKLTVLINNMIVTKDILSFMSGCPNLDMYRDAFCRYWNLGNSIMFYVPVIQSIFSLPETFFTNDDAKIIVNTLLNTLETSNDSSISNLLINCLKSITSESRFRDLGEATAKRALFIVNNLVEWHEPEPAQSEKLDSFPHSQSFEFHTSKPKPSSQRRTSLQAIQFQLACIADS